jgi:hypothetical protein
VLKGTALHLLGGSASTKYLFCPDGRFGRRRSLCKVSGKSFEGGIS